MVAVRARSVNSSRSGNSSAIHLSQTSETTEDGFPANLQDQPLSVLKEHYAGLKQQRRFHQAEQVKHLIDQVRTNSEIETYRRQCAEQTARIDALQEEFRKEKDAINLQWDQSDAAFEEKANEQRESMIAAHTTEMAQSLERWHDEIFTRTPRYSGELLKLRKIEDCLSKQDRISEAIEMQRRADQMEAMEFQAWEFKCDEKIALRRKQLAEKQHSELTGLERRLKAGSFRQEQGRKQECDKLQTRLNLKLAMIEKDQKLIRLFPHCLDKSSCNTSLNSSAIGGA
jgi:hypothetical protein